MLLAPVAARLVVKIRAHRHNWKGHTNSTTSRSRSSALLKTNSPHCRTLSTKEKSIWRGARAGRHAARVKCQKFLLQKTKGERACTWACRSKVTMEKHRFSRKYCSWRHSKAPPTRNAIMFGLRMSSVVQKMCTTPRVTMQTKRTCHTNRSPLFTQFVLQVCARWKIKGSAVITSNYSLSFISVTRQ